MVSVWAYGAGTLALTSSDTDNQTWTTAQTLTQYMLQTTVPPTRIQIEVNGTVMLSSPSVSLKTLYIGCQECLPDHPGAGIQLCVHPLCEEEASYFVEGGGGVACKVLGFYFLRLVEYNQCHGVSTPRHTESV
jgi:hypothetical protein